MHLPFTVVDYIKETPQTFPQSEGMLFVQELKFWEEKQLSLMSAVCWFNLKLNYKICSVVVIWPVDQNFDNIYSDYFDSEHPQWWMLMRCYKPISRSSKGEEKACFNRKIPHRRHLS